MSLFKARDWWSTVSGYEEFHTNRHLVTTSLDPNSLQYDECVFVGSFSGILRAYRPHCGEYTPDDLLLEKQLDGPIIQLAIEHVIEDTVSICLIVLHPRSVVYYSLVTDQDSLSIVTKYNHSLSHTSYSMVQGPFGRTVGHELVCIQSMDGVLTILDHNEVLFSCTLSNFVLPGPIGYNPRTDTIITVGSCRQLQTYRYQSMLSSDTRKTKSIKPEWCIELGEESVDIKVAIQEDGPSLIMVLGERTLYCFKDDSQMIFSKKMDHSCSVIHPYRTESIDNKLLVYYILAGHSKQLQIMKNETMLWAAQLSHVPVSMTTANFKELNGIIATLDELGNLQCSYLGTDPTNQTGYIGVGGASSNQSLKEMDEELEEISLLIKENEDGNQKISQEQLIQITVLEYSKPRPVEGEESEGGETIERQCVECRVRLTNPNPLSTMCNVSSNTDVAIPISVHPSTVVYPFLGGGESETFITTLVYTGNMLPLSLNIIITVSYVNEEGTVQIVDHTSLLPLELFCKPCAPQDGQYKVTLDSSSPCVELSELYNDNNESQSPNAMAYQLLEGSTVTIITSKTSARYRIQSDDFPVLGILLSDLAQRLLKYHNNKISLRVSSQLPLTDYFEILDQHYKMRVGLEQCKELLARHAHQFRAIQKRLLSRFKDKTPSGLLHLDTLLDGTYMQLMMLAEKYDDLFQQEHIYSRQLSNASLLITTFLRLNGELNNDEVAILNSTFAPNISFDSDQGWEEVVDMSVTQLLKSCLAKNVKDQSTSLPELSIPNDSLKIKRHIALLCDRLLKGGKLTVTQSLIETTPTTLGQLPALTEEAEQ